MDKKALEAIVEMAKAAGADVKVVEIKGNESEEGNKENLPTIPLLTQCSSGFQIMRCPLMCVVSLRKIIAWL